MDVYCISLPHRIDRRNQITDMVERYPFLRLHFVDAISAHDGNLGCLRSHKKTVQLAKDAGLPYVLVIEDDCEFILDPEKLKQQCETIVEYMSQHPEIRFVNGGGNLFHMSIQVHDSVKNTFFLRCPDVRTAHFMFYNASSYDLVTQFSDFGAGPIDIQVNNHMMVFTYPYLGVQRPSFSDIDRQFADHDSIRTSMNVVRNHLLGLGLISARCDGGGLRDDVSSSDAHRVSEA